MLYSPNALPWTSVTTVDTCRLERLRESSRIINSPFVSIHICVICRAEIISDHAAVLIICFIIDDHFFILCSSVIGCSFIFKLAIVIRKHVISLRSRSHLWMSSHLKFTLFLVRVWMSFREFWQLFFDWNIPFVPTSMVYFLMGIHFTHKEIGLQLWGSVVVIFLELM